VFVLFFVLFCIFHHLRAVISAIWPFCPVEQLNLHVDFICITCNRLCSPINDDDDDDEYYFMTHILNMPVSKTT